MDALLIVEWIIEAFLIIFVLLGGFAYLTLFERKALARIQVRIGPNRAGPFGVLQPIADAVKLIFKEELTPTRAYKFIFVLAPIITVIPIARKPSAEALSFRVFIFEKLPESILIHNFTHIIYKTGNYRHLYQRSKR